LNRNKELYWNPEDVDNQVGMLIVEP